jgi:hydroxyacylglutathione hydrolase
MDQKRRVLFLWMLTAGGVLIIISGLALIMLNQPSSTPEIPIPTSVEQIVRVSLSDAKVALNAGAAIFVDVRDSSSYQEAHIPGAVLIPLSDLTNHLDELDPSHWIITYCT